MGKLVVLAGLVADDFMSFIVLRGGFGFVRTRLPAAVLDFRNDAFNQ